MNKHIKQKKIHLILWVTLCCNLVVSTVKIGVGYITAINSILADGFHSLADSFSNIIGLISIQFAYKPIDDDHPYGHQRYETLATLFIVALLVYLGIEIFVKSIETFLNPQPLVFSQLTLILMILALIINIFVATFERHYGKKYQSAILIADAKHTASDIYISIGVLLNLVIMTYFNGPIWLDGLTSLIISLIIFKTAYSIFKESSFELTDAIAIDPKEIETIVLAHPQVNSIHKIRSRKSGNHIYIDFHVQCNPTLSLVSVHDISHELQSSLKNTLGPDISVIVHVEPDI